METLTLQALLEADREMLEAALNKDRSPAAAQKALEKEIDRVMYRCLEQYKEPRLRSAAQVILQAMKNTLPMMDAVSEARQWRAESPAAAPKKKLRPAALILLLAGILLILATLLALHFGGTGLSLTLPLLRALLPAAGGMVCLFFSGVSFAKPPKEKGTNAAPAERTEFLIDVDTAWRHLHAAMMLADNALLTVRDEALVEKQKQAAAQAGGALSANEVELFSGLLETAYALRGGEKDGEAQEMIADIRFFLHNGGVEAVDLEKGREGWFEFLPASGGGTLRPALAAEGKLLKKGLASA